MQTLVVDNTKSFNMAHEATLILSIVGAPLAVIALMLYKFNIIKFYENGDFTNAFAVFIEVGIAFFISIILFRYSAFQQQRATLLVREISDTTQELRKVSTDLETLKDLHHEAVLNMISRTLKTIWYEAQNALFVVCKNGHKELDSEDEFDSLLRELLRDHRESAKRALDQLGNLIVMGADLDSDLVEKLWALHFSIDDNVSGRNTGFRTSNRWSNTLLLISEFTKKNFPQWIRNLGMMPYTLEYLPDDIKKKIMTP